MSKFTKRATIGGLVLTRREGDKILFNKGEVIIEVVEVKGHQVRLAFQSSKEITIERGELHEGNSIKPGESSTS